MVIYLLVCTYPWEQPDLFIAFSDKLQACDAKEEIDPYLDREQGYYKGKYGEGYFSETYIVEIQLLTPNTL